jgi:hypothetical protein
MAELDGDTIARLTELFAKADELGPEPALPAAAPIAPTVAAPPSTPTVAAPLPEKKRTRLYDPARRGYMRATKEEGIADEIAAMKAEASGTPFYDLAKDAPSSGEVARRKLGMKKK